MVDNLLTKKDKFVVMRSNFDAGERKIVLHNSGSQFHNI
jgi:hypothetical protein